MKTFDYSFLKTERISNNVLSLFISVEKIQSLMTKNLEIYPKVFEMLQRISNFQSIKISNKIDGIETTDNRLDLLLRKNVKPIYFEDQQLLGYKEVLEDIHNNYSSYQFREYSLRSFHKTLTSYTNSINGGTYKYDDKLIFEMLNDGSKNVIHKPISAKDTNKAMEHLFQAYKIASDDEDIPKLLLIPCVILDFLCIYPFDEGNERMSRLLSLFLLYKSDYDVGKYVSFEKQINNSKTEFYESLRLSTINWDDNSNDYNPFISNFLESLYLCHVELNSRFNILEGTKASKKDRIEQTIKKSRDPISRKEIYQIWPDISQETIKKVIKNLLNDNKIKKIGNFKDARYKRNWYGNTTQNDDNVVIF